MPSGLEKMEPSIPPGGMEANGEMIRLEDIMLMQRKMSILLPTFLMEDSMFYGDRMMGVFMILGGMEANGKMLRLEETDL